MKLPCHLAVVSASILLMGCTAATRTEGGPQETVRVAVIGGMVETGFWDALAERYEKETGHRIELITAGPKPAIVAAFRRGEADLVTMHACDDIINLVADGYAMDPQPWMRNDMVIVGPAEDPAEIRGLTDAGEAIRRICNSSSPFVVHSSLGAQEVLRNLLNEEQVSLEPSTMTLLFSDQARSAVQIASQKHAYTLVGRIPFLNGKLPNIDLGVMVSGDLRLCRPYVVAVADPARFPNTHVKAAQAFVAFLRCEATQTWIAGYGKGQLDGRSIFLRMRDPLTLR
jgi:tungstate transport system substrate-binding protein